MARIRRKLFTRVLFVAFKTLKIYFPKKYSTIIFLDVSFKVERAIEFGFTVYKCFKLFSSIKNICK